MNLSERGPRGITFAIRAWVIVAKRLPKFMGLSLSSSVDESQLKRESVRGVVVAGGERQAVGGFFAVADSIIELGAVEAADFAVEFDDFALESCRIKRVRRCWQLHFRPCSRS